MNDVDWNDMFTVTSETDTALTPYEYFLGAFSSWTHTDVEVQHLRGYYPGAYARAESEWRTSHETLHPTAP